MTKARKNNNMLLLLLFTAVILHIAYKWIKARPPNFPPGLPHVPILGSAPFMPKNNGHFEMEKWREQYGPVVGLILGDQPAVAVCSPKLVREVLKRDEFQGRPISETLKARTFGKRIGLMFSDGPLWQEQRRFTVKHLKDFGFGKTSMESIMLEEIEELIQEIRDQRLQVSGLFNVSSVNILWGIVAGTRYKRSDPRIQKLMDTITRFFRSGISTGASPKLILCEIFPMMRCILPESEDIIATKMLHALFLKTIKEHEDTMDTNYPRDFIDVYIMEMKKQKDPNITSYNEYNDINQSLEYPPGS